MSALSLTDKIDVFFTNIKRKTHCGQYLKKTIIWYQT